MIADEGFYFGLGAFETIALEKGVPVFREAHLARLQKTMQFLNIPRSIEDVIAEAEHFLAENPVSSPRMGLKIAVSPRNILCSLRENPYGRQDYLNGFLTDFSQVRRNETSPLTYHKTLNYGDCILEKRAAHRRNIQEPVFLNTQGALAEGAVSNLFFLRDGQLIAPPLGAGMLPGIVREYVYAHYPVREQTILPEDVPNFQEMFLTNSLLGIMPVQKLADFRFPSMQTGLSMAREFWAMAAEPGV